MDSESSNLSDGTQCPSSPIGRGTRFKNGQVLVRFQRRVQLNERRRILETTLVLDANYRPQRAIPWTQAITKVVADKKAEVIESYPEKYIRTTSWTYEMPSVIRLIIPVKRQRAVKFSRHGIYARDNGRCQYCGMKFGRREWTYDHVIPRVQGGKTCWENIVCACHSCNQRKADKTPEQAGMRLLSKPVRPKKMPLGDEHGMMYQPGMPESWRAYLRDPENYVRDHVYWNVPLEEDK